MKLIEELLLDRYSKGEVQTIGKLFGLGTAKQIIFECDTLELPWKDNRQNVSCIEPKVYWVEKRWSEAHKWHIHILDVTGRTWILIHPANFVEELRGCIAPGKIDYLNTDDRIDVKKSRDTLDALLEMLPDRKVKLTIK
ncbi:DUF5675 family protein [Flavicella sediminum]|uniref:DUF5675 family protein n=1 Tax=Flavicella sediminum TaxID=2585141 RepID=UPI00111F9655|nr:DUF5675 family protein [Flavicella sediminum]